jgi:asparagine synthase (glutamine-hydrolysing)
MSHREWYVADSYFDGASPVAVGRLGIGIFNSSPQPVWNAAHSAALFMAGEFYEFPAGFPVEAGQPDEQVALALYEQYGEDFVRHVKGAFSLTIWDARRRRLLLCSDRFGLYPLYYAYHQGRLVFAPEVKGILCDPGFNRELDLTALAQYVRFQQLLGVRTFFEGIQLLPDASILSYDLSSERLQVRTYWGFEDIPQTPEIHFDEAVEEAGRLFRRAVQRLSNDRYRPGVFLSGGLDSRSILGMIERRPVVTLNFGNRMSSDVRYAAQIARLSGSEHYWFDMPDGRWVKEYADFHLDLTEGFHSWIHMHGIQMLEKARGLIDVNLTGWDGHTLVGSDWDADPLLNFPVDEASLTCYLFNVFNQKSTWPSINEPEEKLLYVEPLAAQLRGLAFDSFREELAPYHLLPRETRWRYFFIRNHDGRLTKNMITIARSYIEVRFPFFDYDLFDFLNSLPLEIRRDRLVHRGITERETPQVSRIPYDPYGNQIPTTSELILRRHKIRAKVKRGINKYIYPVFPKYATLYADYEDYLRGDLREWAEEILFDPRTAARGIFDPTFLRSLMDRHLSGTEEWTVGKIAPLMTYEMMLRRLFDT